MLKPALLRGVPAGAREEFARLDEATQRRLILRAARERCPDRLRELRSRQPTLAELDGMIKESAWGGVLLAWTLIGLLAFYDTAQLGSVRQAALLNHGTWQTSPDPEAELWVLEGDVRRLLKAVPRRSRGTVKQVSRHLEQMVRHWTDLQRKLQSAGGPRQPGGEGELEARRAEVAARLEVEADPTTAGSLERQLASLEGQMEAERSLGAWRARLEASQQECMETLRHLRTRLAVLSTAGQAHRETTINDATSELQQLNARLAATQSASEELMLLRG